jgi:hypothetical protein
MFAVHLSGLLGSAVFTIPFVVVVPDLAVVDVLAGMHTVGGAGFTTMEDDDIARFRAAAGARRAGGAVPAPRRRDGRRHPRRASRRRAAPARRPGALAADRRGGLSVLVSASGVLRSRNAFSLLGSRTGDKRVPALWTSDRRPRLGWCYEGAPHTWLGSASCAGRIGQPAT